MTRILLDSVRQDIDARTYRMVNRARVRTGHKADIEAPSLQSLCAALVELGVKGEAEVFRGETPVFTTPIDIERMAKGTWGTKPHD